MIKQPITGLLFDKDGTLIDLTKTWLAPITQIGDLMLERGTLPCDLGKLLEVGGWQAETHSWRADSIIAFGTNRELLDYWSELTGAEINDQLLNDAQSIVDQGLRKAAPIVADTAELLKQLSGEYTLGVASMDDERNIHRTLIGLEINELFDFVCGADSGFGIKPEPGMVQAFCAQTGIPARQVAVIGDSDGELIMAKNAGAIGIGVLSGGQRHDDLAQYTDYVIDDISQLKSVLG